MSLGFVVFLALILPLLTTSSHRLQRVALRLQVRQGVYMLLDLSNLEKATHLLLICDEEVLR